MRKNLPQSVVLLAEVIGVDAAMKLAIGSSGRQVHRSYPSGRVMLYVPKRPKRNSRVSQRIGWDLSQKLSKHFAGETLTLAACSESLKLSRNVKIAYRMTMNPRDKKALADEYGIGSKTVDRIANGPLMDEITVGEVMELARNDHSLIDVCFATVSTAARGIGAATRTFAPFKRSGTETGRTTALPGRAIGSSLQRALVQLQKRQVRF